MAMHRYKKNGQIIRITGPSIGNYADPAIACLTALQVTTSAFAVNLSPGYPDPMDIVSLVTLRELTDSAIDAFSQRKQERISAKIKCTELENVDPQVPGKVGHCRRRGFTRRALWPPCPALHERLVR